MQIGKNCCFYEEAGALPGVKYIAGLVKKDIELVTDAHPESADVLEEGKEYILYGTVGHSELLGRLEHEGKIDLSPIKGKREVYVFRISKIRREERRKRS